MPLYEQSRTCHDCGNVESRMLTEMDAAFEERREWLTSCDQCGSYSFSSGYCAIPDINEDILETWAHHEGLTILQQDEDLVMASVGAFPLLTDFVRRQDIPVAKRNVLLSALCVIVYDNTPNGDDPDAEYNHEIAESAINFLSQHKGLFTEIGDQYICNYIKQIVYPLIGLDPQETS